MSRRRFSSRREARRRTLETVGVIALAFLAVAVAAGAVAHVSNESPPTSGARHWTPPPEVEKRSVFVIGDSWTEGGTMNSGLTWPFLMDLPEGWNVLADGRAGTGYIGDSALTSGGRLDTDLREYAPDLVLVAMGRNDVQWDPDEVIDAARTDLSAMKKAWPDATIVVFSPWSPEPPVEWTVTLTARLRALADSLGLPFLDVSHYIGDRPSLIDLKQPNDAGHAVIAKAVGDDLAKMGAFN